MLSSLPYVALALLLATLIHLTIRLNSRSRPKQPPGPPTLPIIGNYHQLYPYMKEKRGHKFGKQMFDQYGLIFKLSIFGRNVVVVGDAAVAKMVLTKKELFYRDEMFQKMHSGISHYALFTLPAGEVWHKHRKYMQPSFGPTHIQNTAVIAQDAAKALSHIWSSFPTNHEFNIHYNFACLTLDVIGRLAFSYEFKMVDSLAHPQSDQSMLQTFEDIITTVSKRFGLPHWAWKFIGVAESDIEPKVTRIRSIILDVVKQKTNLINDGQYNPPEGLPLDMLDRLIQATTGQAKVEFSDDEMVDEVYAIFGAGSETSTQTLTFCIMTLAQHPAVYERVVSEILSVVGAEGEVTYESLNQMPYLNAFIRETMRLYPVVGAIPRTSSQDLEMMGYHIPKDTSVQVNVRYIHRDNKYWKKKDADAFRPERWLNDELTTDVPCFLPFGDGPMNCIGQKIALTEIKTVLAVLVRKWRFELVEGQELEPVQTITTGLKDGLFVRVEARI